MSHAYSIIINNYDTLLDLISMYHIIYNNFHIIYYVNYIIRVKIIFISELNNLFKI